MTRAGSQSGANLAPGPGPVARSVGRARRTLRRSLRRVVVRNVIRGATAAVGLTGRADPHRHGVQLIENQPYQTTDAVAHRLDVLKPVGYGDSLPVLIYVHGGGFSMLSKESHRQLALAYARRGYLVFNINYRLAPSHPFPSALEDTCAAFSWAVEHARRFGGDVDRLVFAGESAGANLVTGLAIATTFKRDEPYAKKVFELGVVPRAVIPACGIFQVSDVERLWRRRPMPSWVRLMLNDVATGYLGDGAARPSDVSRLADPLLILEGDVAPARPMPSFFIPVGTKDPLLDDTRRLDAALAARGEHSEARYYEGEIHAFHALGWRPAARQCWRDTFDFLDRVLSSARK